MWFIVLAGLAGFGTVLQQAKSKAGRRIARILEQNGAFLLGVDEVDYEDHLVEVLREHEPRAKVRQQVNVGSRRLDVEFRLGKSAVAIELKRAISRNSHVDRALAQVAEYLTEYDEVFVFVVETTDSWLDELRLGLAPVSDAVKVVAVPWGDDEGEDEGEDDE